MKVLRGVGVAAVEKFQQRSEPLDHLGALGTDGGSELLEGLWDIFDDVVRIFL